jgi:hypothetical protein
MFQWEKSRPWRAQTTIHQEHERRPMTELFRAIVIDPKARTIDVVVTDLTPAHIHELVEATTLDNFLIAEFEGGWDQCWVNDTGLSDEKPIHAFKFCASPLPLAGRCLIIGVDRATRNTCDAFMPLDFVVGEIEWVGLILPEVTMVEESPGHMRNVVTYRRLS